MKRSYLTSLVVFGVSMALLFATSLPSIAASFSGRAVDEDGQPVEGLIVALPSFPGNTPPDWDEQFEAVFPPTPPSKTDATGAFSIRGIATPSVCRLTLFPEHNSDYEILSVEIEGIPVYLDQRHFGGLFFRIAPEAAIENVEITVRLRMRIRGRVIFADGTPLRNARVNLMVEHRDIDGRGEGSSSRTPTLDNDGYFVYYVDDGGAYYTVSVRYRGHIVESEEILLEEGQRMDGLVLKLSGESAELPQPERVVVAPRPRPRVHDPARFQAARKREREGVWAINPDNRHGYKMIYCETLAKAKKQAAEQGAHLVAINDKAEQDWLLEVFGKQENFWIGSISSSEDGKLAWGNGEPVAYWASPQAAAELTTSDQDGDAKPNSVVLVGMIGKWQVAPPGSPLTRMTERAILEKENFAIGAPEPEGDGKKP